MATFTTGQRVGIVRGVQSVNGPKVYAYGTVLRPGPWGTDYVVQTEDGSELVYESFLLREIPTPTDRELSAIDAIRAAYMACNHADESEQTGTVSPLAYEYSVDRSYPPSPMGHLAAAGREAWKALGLPGHYLWHLMADSGEGAAYVLAWWKVNG